MLLTLQLLFDADNVHPEIALGRQNHTLWFQCQQVEAEFGAAKYGSSRDGYKVFEIQLI